MRRLAIVGTVGALLIGGMVGSHGCADRTRVRTTETIRQRDTSYPPATVATSEYTTTTTTRTTDEGEGRGVLSSLVHFVGEIIALPFRLVGGLIRAIF